MSWRVVLLCVALLAAAQADTKRGAAVWVPEDEQFLKYFMNLSATNGPGYISWWHSWAAQPGPETLAFANQQVPALEYVPTCRDEEQVSRLAQELATVVNLTSMRYLLGFNEPDTADKIAGSAMSPETAAELWPTLERLAAWYNLTLISPSTTYDGEAWLEEFLDICNKMYCNYPDGTVCAAGRDCKLCHKQQQGCYFDVIQVHPYTCEVHKLKERLSFWEGFGYPLWVTEFGCAVWEIPCMEAKYGSWTPKQAADNLAELMEVLDTTPSVARYAYWWGEVPGGWHTGDMVVNFTCDETETNATSRPVAADGLLLVILCTMLLQALRLP